MLGQLLSLTGSIRSSSPRIVYGDFGACACSRYQALFSPPPREPGDEAKSGLASSPGPTQRGERGLGTRLSLAGRSSSSSGFYINIQSKFSVDHGDWYSCLWAPHSSYEDLTVANLKLMTLHDHVVIQLCVCVSRCVCVHFLWSGLNGHPLSYCHSSTKLMITGPLTLYWAVSTFHSEYHSTKCNVDTAQYNWG